MLRNRQVAKTPRIRANSQWNRGGAEAQRRRGAEMINGIVWKANKNSPTLVILSGAKNQLVSVRGMG